MAIGNIPILFLYCTASTQLMEYEMTSSAFAISSSSDLNRSYAANVSLAARGFIAALLAVKAVKPAQATATREVSPRDRTKARAELNRLAAEYESLCPNLSRELQHFASNC
jgi:hypothetical protein